MTQGHYAGAGQGGDVDDGGGFETLGVGQGVAQDQAALGVCIKYFNGLARHTGDDVARLVGLAARHIFAGRNNADDVLLQLQFGQGTEGAQDAGGAAHIVFHLVHGGGGLDRYATRVERDAFTDEYRRARALGGFLCRFTGVTQDDEAQRLVGALGDRQEGTHAQGFDLFAIQNLYFDGLEFAA